MGGWGRGTSTGLKEFGSRISKEPATIGVAKALELPCFLGQYEVVGLLGVHIILWVYGK